MLWVCSSHGKTNKKTAVLTSIDFLNPFDPYRVTGVLEPNRATVGLRWGTPRTGCPSVAGHNHTSIHMLWGAYQHAMKHVFGWTSTGRTWKLHIERSELRLEAGTSRCEARVLSTAFRATIVWTSTVKSGVWLEEKLWDSCLTCRSLEPWWWMFLQGAENRPVLVWTALHLIVGQLFILFSVFSNWQEKF